MPELAADSLRIADEFPPVSTEQWEAAILADLAGADYDKTLIWRTDEGIAVRPYYRAEDAAGLSGLDALQLHAPRPEVLVNAAQFAESGATSVQELAYGLALARERVAEGVDPGSVGLVFSISSNFFFEIAKLRAARILWQEVAGRPLYVEARTTFTDKSIYDPYTNLIRASTEAMSAVIGGAAQVTVQPFGFTERLAENVVCVLREEARLDAVADPAAGSWYVEVLTASIADEARKLMEYVAAQGGFADARQSIDAEIARSRAARDKAVAQRGRVLVGVNSYPDLDELRDPADMPPIAEAVWRAAAPFEAIRLRSDAWANRHGRRPTVLLLTRGDLNMRQVRARFCQNFFGCGGFATVESHDLNDPADLVVLCSSDPEYPALAAEICPRSKQPVIIAGNPKEHMDALNALGVAGYVHFLSNAVETLAHWQQQLGIRGEEPR